MNFLQIISHGWTIMLLSFLITGGMRRYVFTKKISCLWFYGLGTLMLFFLMIVGGSVQNDRLLRFQQFLCLEREGKLPTVKLHPKAYDPMLVIDIEAFKNSKKFEDEIVKWDLHLDRMEAVGIGWIFAALVDFLRFLGRILQRWRQNKAR